MKTHAIHLQEFHAAPIQQAGVSVSVKRLDLIHPEISGNKYYKLKYNLEEARKTGHRTLLTFGGAYSNHIYATAAAANLHGFNAIGIIRGEETLPLNNTLAFARSQGMKLHYISREDYRRKTEASFIDLLNQQFGGFYMIPEGGTNALAIKGTREILSEEDGQMDFIIASAGTGGTAAGLILSQNRKAKIIIIPSLKGDFMEVEIRKWLPQDPGNWEVVNDYHFGGYAKFTPELSQFITEMEQKHQLPLDPVYTGKAFYGLLDLISKNRFPVNAKILFIHTGGLQGRGHIGS